MSISVRSLVYKGDDRPSNWENIAGTVDQTTSSFTPNNNTLLVVFVHCQFEGESNPGLVAVSDSAGLTWTRRAEWPEEWEYCVAYSAPVSTGTSMTVTCDFNQSYRCYAIEVVEITEYDPAAPIGSAYANTWSLEITGAISNTHNIVFSPTPTANNLVLTSSRFSVANNTTGGGGTGVITTSTGGFTLISNQSSSISWVQTRYHSSYSINFASSTIAQLYTGTQSSGGWYNLSRIGLEINEEIVTGPVESTFSLTESSDTLSSSSRQFSLAQTARGQGTHNSSANNFSISSSGNFANGSWAALSVAVDNSATSGAAHTSFTVTDTKNNTWTRRVSPLYDPGAASAGVEGAIFTTSQDGGTLTTGDTITIRTGTAATAKAWTLTEIYSIDENIGVHYSTGAVGTGSATNAPTITTSTLSSGSLLLASIFNEYGTAQTITGDNDTTRGTWSTQQTAEIGSTASGMSISTQTKVITSSGTQTYNPTLGTSSDVIAAWISFIPTRLQIDELAYVESVNPNDFWSPVTHPPETVLTTSSFTPENNSLLVVIAAFQVWNMAENVIEVDDSVGLEWTKRTYAIQEYSDETTFTHIHIWTAPVTTGTSMTVSVTPGVVDEFNNGEWINGVLQVLGAVGYNTTSPVGALASYAALDEWSTVPSANTIATTYDATPNTSSIVVSAALIQTNIDDSSYLSNTSGTSGYSVLRNEVVEDSYRAAKFISQYNRTSSTGINFGYTISASDTPDNVHIVVAGLEIRIDYTIENSEALFNVSETNDSFTLVSNSEVGASFSRAEANDSLTTLSITPHASNGDFIETSDVFTYRSNVSVSSLFTLIETDDTFTTEVNVITPNFLGDLTFVELTDTFTYRSTVDSEGTFSLTESDDTFTITATAPRTGYFEFTESDDTFTLESELLSGGSIEINESDDTFSLVANSIVGGSLELIETSDSLGTQSTVNVVATFGLTETSDIIDAFVGVELVEWFGDLSVTESDDSFTLSSNSIVGGSLELIETVDTLSSEIESTIVSTVSITETDDEFDTEVNIPVISNLSLTETSDSFTLSSTLNSNGSLGITETSDSFITAVDVSVLSDFNSTETDDSLSTLIKVDVISNLSSTETDDTLSSEITVVDSEWFADLSLTETNDTLVTNSVAYISASISINESSDILESTTNSDITSNFDSTESDDILTTLVKVDIFSEIEFTESDDTIIAESLRILNGNLISTEASDSLDASIETTINSSVVINENEDLIVSLSSVDIASEFDHTETNDNLSTVVQVPVLSDITISESNDSFSLESDVLVKSNITISESDDSFESSIGGSFNSYATINELPDELSSEVNIPVIITSEIININDSIISNVKVPVIASINILEDPDTILQFEQTKIIFNPLKTSAQLKYINRLKKKIKIKDYD